MRIIALYFSHRSNFVGKRLGCHAYTQDQINELIVVMARKHGHVVRLKGGDPFVFGRGIEEIDYAEQHGIATAIVPGISSALGVPVANRISLTQRHIAESFWVITGTTSNHELSKDVITLAAQSAAAVILMGCINWNKFLVFIKVIGMTIYLLLSLFKTEPKRSKKSNRHPSSISQLVEQHQLSSPAIIIIGETVRHANLTNIIWRV